MLVESVSVALDGIHLVPFPTLLWQASPTGMSVLQLRRFLRAMGQPTSGLKPVLSARLEKAVASGAVKAFVDTARAQPRAAVECGERACEFPCAPRLVFRVFWWPRWRTGCPVIARQVCAQALRDADTFLCPPAPLPTERCACVCGMANGTAVAPVCYLILHGETLL